MSLYGTYKKRCPKRMGIALGDEDLNSFFENEPFPNHQTSKKNPLIKRPLSYYNELYDCLSNLNDQALGNRSHSLDESTFVPDAVQNEQEINKKHKLTFGTVSEDLSEPKLLDEIGLTVQKLISQCNELSKARNLELEDSLKICKIVDRQHADKVIYEVNLSPYSSQCIPDKRGTNINLIINTDLNGVAVPHKKELLISFSGKNLDKNVLENSQISQNPNGNPSLDTSTPGNETDFYYSIDDINSAVGPEEEAVKSAIFDFLNNSGNLSNSEVESGSELKVVRPNREYLGGGSSNLSTLNYQKDLVGDSENNLLSSSDFDDKYQADISSCEDLRRIVVHFELNVDEDKSTDATCESSESSSSPSAKSGSYRLTESDMSSGERIPGKHDIPENLEIKTVDSDCQFSASNASDRISFCEELKFGHLTQKKLSFPDLTEEYSTTSNGVSFFTDDSEGFSAIKCSEIFTPEEIGFSDSIASKVTSSLAENVGYSNSNTLDRLSFYSEEVTGFSNPESSNGLSFYSENAPSNVEISKSSFCSEDFSGNSNHSSSNGACYSENSTTFSSNASNELLLQSKNNTVSNAGKYSEDKTLQLESESETSISSDIVAWQRDIFLSVLDDSDEDWIIHDRAEWFSSNDYEGRVYFFEENSNESSWTLPEAPDTNNINESPGNDKESTQEASPIQDSSPRSVKTENSPEEKGLSRSVKSRSMILLDSKLEELTPMSRNWPQLWNGHMCILQEGPLNRTKITENGKRLRKNWASAYVVLTELFLLFFKDAKSFAAMKNGGWKPELCVDLNGALIDRGEKVSSRKNVFIISTVLGLQVLIQCDCTQQANSWLTAIQSAIKNLPSGFDNCSRLIRNSTSPECNSPEGGKKAKIGRSKSVKLKNKDGSIEDLTISVAERQTKIRARLKKFFHRRPTMESLVKKGIWKDEPVFGCYLEQVCANESPRVPQVVQQCIKCIELTEENMKADGLYRASGNLSQVQKLRLQVDQNNLAVLDQEEDVHVLTGALKLFFRELKEPLIPCHLFNKALKASTSHSRKEKLNCFREITKALPPANYDTLKFLLQHLLRVTKYKEFNRMHIPNIAIVFGPTLMWPAQESTNMALDLMQQNLVIESFLVEFDQIFR